MEGVNINESASKELDRILKSLGSDVITIDFTKMDIVTAGKIRDAIKTAAYARKSGLNSIITGVNKF